MATQPITSAHKRSHRFLSLDVGAILLATSLASHWQSHTAAALVCGVAGVVVLAIGGYQAMRQSRRPAPNATTSPEAASDTYISRPHHS